MKTDENWIPRNYGEILKNKEYLFKISTTADVTECAQGSKNCAVVVGYGGACL